MKLIKSIKIGDTVIKKGTELNFDNKGCCEIEGICVELNKIPAEALELDDTVAVKGIEAEGELLITPAEGTPNTHLILFGDQEVGRIIAKKIMMASYPDEGYMNTDDNKLYIKDNAGNDIKVDALNKDTVLIPELVQQLTDYFAANENLTQDIFNNYPNAEGVVYAHDIKVIDLSDLFDMCDVVKDMTKVLPTVKFTKDKVVTVEGQGVNAVLNFDKSTYFVEGEHSNPIETFIRSHFGKELTKAKPEVAAEALQVQRAIKFLNR